MRATCSPSPAWPGPSPAQLVWVSTVRPQDTLCFIASLHLHPGHDAFRVNAVVSLAVLAHRSACIQSDKVVHLRAPAASSTVRVYPLPKETPSFMTALPAAGAPLCFVVWISRGRRLSQRIPGFATRRLRPPHKRQTNGLATTMGSVPALPVSAIPNGCWSPLFVHGFGKEWKAREKKKPLIMLWILKPWPCS
ncbi:hypothetical protein MAPG_03963 [Magnaporthiopsis poae ATCC 64411]|uniref:Uncharacterized protein n=1 Tax=Magnaporthiopsis poae (strain ATCC 64411 / 73-15) TaxID=644358 RepID=A0A0C4DVF9_MAGP6|nr:hypothetical protein MAPG_03963 [Magnaporthiopsis poae ATCC 64411]